MTKLALVDVETTGGNPQTDRVIDIGIILLDDYRIVYEWQSLINPEAVINPFITGITGITNQDVQSAPKFQQLADQVTDLLKDRIFVAHNARFDYLFLKHEYLRLKENFTAPQLCTVKLSRLLYPEFRHHNLDAIIERLNLSIDNRHRALPDAKVMFSLLENSIKHRGLAAVEGLIGKILKRPALPTHISVEDIESLPSTVGVYTFFDIEGTPLYVGKSVNIKSRIMSHFYDDTFSQKELSLKQRVCQIDTRICAGELEALLVESRLVKELLPLSNRKLRHSKGLWLAKKLINDQGYLQITLDPVSYITYKDRDQVVAITKSKRQLTAIISNLCQENGLCPKLCGLEKGQGNCFSYHLGTCQGACQNLEKPADYNRRVETACSQPAIRPWPYAGPVVAYERNDDTEHEAFHLIHNWVVFKTVSSLDDLESVRNMDGPICLDEYNILKNYLTKCQVVPLEIAVAAA